MKLFNWKRQPRRQNVTEAKLPGQSLAGEGVFDPNSPTGVFIKAWALRKRMEFRRENDNLSLDDIKTACLRAKIELLGDILLLPETKETAKIKEIMELEFEQEDEAFAGY